MSFWNFWPAFFRLKGILRNSKRPKGVITAAFGTSAAAMGIW